MASWSEARCMLAGAGISVVFVEVDVALALLPLSAVISAVSAATSLRASAEASDDATMLAVSWRD